MSNDAWCMVHDHHALPQGRPPRSARPSRCSHSGPAGSPCPGCRPAPGGLPSGRRLQMGSALIGVTANRSISYGTFWVLPLTTYLYIPKCARAYLFLQSVKIHNFCSGPVSVDPTRTQAKQHALLRGGVRGRPRDHER